MWTCSTPRGFLSVHSNSVSLAYLFAGEPHEYISHDALPLALEHTLLQGVEELQMLLDQKPQRAGKWTAERQREGKGGDTDQVMKKWREERGRTAKMEEVRKEKE